MCRPLNKTDFLTINQLIKIEDSSIDYSGEINSIFT